MPRSFFILIVLGLILFPAYAHANAGTPLMWATMLHLIFGNLLLGIGEGLTLAYIFRISKWKTVLLMILANYASAWLGFLFFIISEGYWDSLTIENLHIGFWLVVLATYALTLLSEFPFIYLATLRKGFTFRKILLGMLAVQGVSYLLLFGWYWISSDASLLFELDPVRPTEIAAPRDHSLYYIDSTGKSVVRADLQGEFIETIAMVSVEESNGRLYARPNARNGYDLYLYHDRNGQENDRSELIRENFSPRAPVDSRIMDNPSAKPDGSFPNWGKVPTLITDNEWEYWTGVWAIEGISGRNMNSGEEFRYAIELPFAYWYLRNAVHIQDDFILFQLTGDQICLLRHREKSVALLARGKGPIVARDFEKQEK